MVILFNSLVAYGSCILRIGTLGWGLFVQRLSHVYLPGPAGSSVCRFLHVGIRNPENYTVYTHSN